MTMKRVISLFLTALMTLALIPLYSVPVAADAYPTG